MDTDGDSQVTREEWLAAMLVRLHYVDASVIEKITARFTLLDVDNSGSLSMTDLMPTKKKANTSETVLGDSSTA